MRRCAPLSSCHVALSSCHDHEGLRAGWNAGLLWKDGETQQGAIAEKQQLLPTGALQAKITVGGEETRNWSLLSCSGTHA